MATPSEVELLLVRGSRTEWDETARLGGDCDLPACKAWGEELTAALRDHDLSAITGILTSPDEASTQTAHHIGKLADKKVRTIDDLREIDLGLWEGQRMEQLVERFPAAFKQWKEDPTSVVSPEGESFADAETRLLNALAKGLDKLNGKGRHVAVVLRPMAFHVLRNRLQGLDLVDGWDAAAVGPKLVPMRVRRDEIVPAKAV
ncbi:MAG: histidine phosphatase family protein [Phycisphaera sp.]|nr:MAG: histidine phosphatase family protein [Phycisphaera sp.]